MKADEGISYVKTLESGFPKYEITIPSLMEENQPPKKEDNKKPVILKDKQLKKGQIGQITVTKDINLWKREGTSLFSNVY